VNRKEKLANREKISYSKEEVRLGEIA